MPYWAATSRTGRFSITTAVITKRLIAIAAASRPATRHSGMTRDIIPG